MMPSSDPISQEAIMEMIIPLLKKEGAVYRKFRKVWAKKARGGETITSITSDGTETVNQTESGDFIVMNLTKAKEMYVVKPDAFQKRYEYEREAEDGFSEFHPIGKVVAIEMTVDFLKSQGLEDEFKFIAPWGEEIIVKKNDFLVSPPDFSQVYRIARTEFYETYGEEKRK